MKQKSMFFPGFNRLGLGRKPHSAHSKIARQFHQIDGLCLAQLQMLCGHLLPAWLTCFKTASKANSLMRVFTPALTCCQRSQCDAELTILYAFEVTVLHEQCATRFG